MKKFTILLTFLIFGFLAESHYNTNSTLQTEQCAVETGQFTISDSSVVIGAAYNSSVSVLVNSDQTIYSLSNQQWMWVEIIESDEINSEEYVLYITAVRNPFNFTRTGTIEVSNESGQKLIIRVMQRANTFNLLELSGEFLAIDASDDSIFTIDVMSNTHWNVSCSEDWLELTKNTGTGNQAVGIWAHENTLQTDRQALVTFTANNASTRVLRVR